MANTEKTFADILGRATELSEAIENFTPAFTPADATLAPAAFETFVTGLLALNSDTNDQNGQYSTAATERKALVAAVKATALRALRYVQSNKAWASHAASLKLPYDKLRNNHPPRDKSPAPTPPAEQKKALKLGQQSYADIQSHFAKFVAGLGKIPGYAPAAGSGLTLTELEAQSDALKAKNTVLADLANSLAIKNAALSQYGKISPQYTSIKGLKF